jgi:hypothetical protein
MKIQLGDLLQGTEGQFYRVIECQDEMLSLLQVDGCTLFSCRFQYAELVFSPVEGNADQSYSLARPTATIAAPKAIATCVQ